MSKFSEKCKELMKENGTNVYRLANSSSLERTTLQRMVTGKRLPSLDFVKQFCQALRMSIPEREKLLELYKIEQVGADTYYKRKLIGSTLTLLADTEETHYAYSAIEKNSSINMPPLSGSSFSIPQQYNTELAITTVLEDAFSASESCIRTNLPVSQGAFLHLIQMLFQKYPDSEISIDHIFNFQISETATYENLEVLCKLLPLALFDSSRYNSWYHYSKIQKEDLLQSLFPYYIITPSVVLEISGDFKNYVAHSELEKIQLYTSEFKKIQSISERLFSQHHNPQAAWEHYTKLLPPSWCPVYIIEAQPCFYDMMSEELISQITMEHPDYNSIVKDMPKYAGNFMEREIHGIFSKEGLDLFWNTGKLYGQIGAFLSPLSQNQRILCLENFRNRIPRHKRNMVITKLRIPRNLNFEIYDHNRLHIIQIDQNLNISLLVITESSICEAFYDFVIALSDPEEEIVSTEQKTNDYIESLLKSC